jgi:hypothetical protein
MMYERIVTPLTCYVGISSLRYGGEREERSVSPSQDINER